MKRPQKARAEFSAYLAALSDAQVSAIMERERAGGDQAKAQDAAAELDRRRRSTAPPRSTQ